MTRVWRVFVSDLPSAQGARVEIRGDEAHHVGRVLRLAEGERVNLFDGRGAEWAGAICRVEPGCVEIRLDHPVTEPVEAPVRVVLFQSLDRADRLDWVVQKATEIGVSAFCWTATARAARGAKPRRLERLRRIVHEACKQSGRRVALEVLQREELPEVPRDVKGILLDPSPEAASLGTILEDPPPGEVWLAVGPESGLSPGEVEEAAGRGWSRARLGPRILRADTAGIVAASIVLHRWGDLGTDV